MNRQKWIASYVVSMCIFMILINSTYISAEDDKETGTLSISADAAKSGYWEDSQWIFYVAQCPSEEQIIITLEYSGDLNLDLVILVDSTGTKTMAWDITHCGWDEALYPKAGYSAIDTTDTKKTGPEKIIYLNLNPETVAVYILIYAAAGEGISQYTLTCSNTVNPVPNSSLERCWTILQAWILFGVGCIIFSIIFLKIVKRAIMTPDQKAAEKLKKEEAQKQKAKKAKATGKAPSSMAARKSSR